MGVGSAGGSGRSSGSSGAGRSSSGSGGTRGGSSAASGRSASGRGTSASSGRTGRAAGNKAASTKAARTTARDSFTAAYKVSSRALSGQALGKPQSFSGKAPPRDSFTSARTTQRPAGKAPTVSRALSSSFMDTSSFAPSPSRPTNPVASRALNGKPMGTPNSFVSRDRAVSTPARSFRPSSPNDLLGQLQPAGASAETANQDRLSSRGVMASRTLAEKDLQRMDAYKDRLQEAARQHGVPSAVLAGIASRESRAGLALKPSGFAKYDPAGFGVMQIDVTKNRGLVSTQATPADAYSQEHFNRAAGLLSQNVKDVRKAHPDWSEADVLRGAVAAYNFGVRNAQNLDTLDIGTTGNDYSGDVIARSQYFSERGF